MSRIWEDSADRIWEDSIDRIWENIDFSPIVEQPVFNPSDGLYSKSINIEITSATPGSSIYYTTDGSTPTISSELYITPISVFEGTLKAIAVLSGYINSAITSAAYTLITPTLWNEFKDLGPASFNFTEQPDKWGYLNNPKWQTTPQPVINYTGNENNEPQVWNTEGAYSVGGSKVHIPCGHWHKRSADSDGEGGGSSPESNEANLYGNTGSVL
ncbi:MAG: chitobiase/beta-hexosaminidase C-terminal domain-containing protein, partial [Candidatus Omnitrophica bacterium]|nr:chitobiase/beta-hexosaminidase C-terminal domain-containing protein [Candidatus Omnitrophota bacterium]